MEILYVFLKNIKIEMIAGNSSNKTEINSAKKNESKHSTPIIQTNIAIY
jgi:hypothetical protein